MSKPSYEYDFDPEATNNTAASIYRLVREGGPRVLDLGSGPGIVAGYLATRDERDVTCLDADAEYLARARENGVAHTVQADLEDPAWIEQLDSGTFDVVVLADVLEHLRKPEAVLTAILDSGILTPEGFLVVSVPNAAHESVLSELMTGNFAYRDDGLLDRTHVSFFTLASFEAMAEANGFGIVKTLRTRRNLEHTSQKQRAAEVPPEMRRQLRELNPDVDAFQYIMKLVPSSRGSQHAKLLARAEELELEIVDRRASEAAHEKRHSELMHEIEELRKRVAAQTKTMEGQRAALASQRRGQLERLQESRTKEAKARSDAEAARKERDEAVAAAKAASRQVKAIHASFTWRAGRLVKALFAPAIWLRNSLKRSAETTPAADLQSKPDERNGSDLAPRATLALNTEEVSALRAEYLAAVRRRRFSSDEKRVAMAVATLDFSEGRGDVYVAVGLGRYLERLGYEIIYLPKEDWYDPPPETDIYVALLSSVDALRLPGDCFKVAWVRNETEVWAANPSLNVYDLLLASSRQSVDFLERSFAGRTGVLPIGVDLELFDGDPSQDRSAVVSTVNQWGRERDVYSAVRSKPFDWSLAIFGQTRGLAPELQPFSSGPVSFFSLPTIYRQAALVLDDFNHTTVGFGNVNSRVFEALASGALPVTNSSLGLAPLGLEQVPSYLSPREFHDVVDELLEDAHRREQLVADLAKTVRERHSYQRRAEQFDDLIGEAMAQTGGQRSRALVTFFPDYRSTNPYQTMLYRSLADDAALVPISDPFEIDRVPGREARRTAFHVHWTAPILNPAEDSTEALARLDRFVAAMDRLKAGGGRIIWTVHNAMPHECPYPDLEKTLRQELADRADVVHIMCNEALEEVSEFFVIPEDKVRVIAHGSYIGLYPDLVTVEDARGRLGVAREDTLLLFLGGIRPYKGLDVLLEAFDRARALDPGLKLMVLGRPGRFPGVRELEQRAASMPGVTANFNMIADEDLQHFFKAADVVVLPYRSILNSGSVQLALSFGRPVIASRLGCIPDVERAGIGMLVTPGDVDDLTRKLLASADLKGREVRIAARRHAEGYTAQDMSRDFKAVLNELWD